MMLMIFIGLRFSIMQVSIDHNIMHRVRVPICFRRLVGTAISDHMILLHRKCVILCILALHAIFYKQRSKINNEAEIWNFQIFELQIIQEIFLSRIKLLHCTKAHAETNTLNL